MATTTTDMREDSTEYLTIPITANVDFSADTIQVAFTATKTSLVAPTDWHTADHVAGGVRILIGPGGLTLPAGQYVVLIKVADTPEVPVIAADGKLRILAVA